MGLLETLASRLAGVGSSERVSVAGIEYDPSTITGRNDVDEELGLTEREFVEAILVDNHGRVRQRALTRYTSWSDSQAGQVLLELESDGAIVRTRVGRETHVRLPDEGEGGGLVAPRSE